MTAFKPCQHCRNGFALDNGHPTEMRLKECPECRGTGRIPDPAGKPEIRFKPMDVVFDCNTRNPRRLVLEVNPKYYPNHCYQVAGRDWNGSCGVHDLMTRDEWLRWLEKFRDELKGREFRECMEAALGPFEEPACWADFRKRFAETGSPWVEEPYRS